MYMVAPDLYLTDINSTRNSHNLNRNRPTSYLRWDRADLAYNRELTRVNFTQFLSDLRESQKHGFDTDMIDWDYNRIVYVLQVSAESCVPKYHKNFFKYWWDLEMDDLKGKSIASCKLWKEPGRPRSGPVFDKYKRDKSAYKHGLRLRQSNKTERYTNDLHEARPY